MEMPKMAIFDYGHTLIAELGYTPINGTKAVMEFCTKNPKGLSIGQIEDEATLAWDKTNGLSRKIGLDIPFLSWQRLLNETLGLEFSISGLDYERAYWDGAGPAAKMPYIEEALGFLKESGIRSAVMSNIAFSEAALRDRITRLIPDSNFEFFISSSEYALRKPSRLLYRLACEKAGLGAGEAWFLGDNAAGDINGPFGYGMFPVWYQDRTLENPFASDPLVKPDCPHLEISDWRELRPRCLEIWK